MFSLILMAMMGEAQAQMSTVPLFGSSVRKNTMSNSRKTRQPQAVRKDSVRTQSDLSEPSEVFSPSHFFISGYYSGANEGTYSGNANVKTLNISSDYKATESTEGAPGLAGGYMYKPEWGFGFSGLVGYEFPRKSKGIKGTAGNLKITGTYEGDVSTSLISGVANGLFVFNRWIYLSAGFNYPFIMTDSNADLTGLPGYQLGLGSSVTNHLGVRLEYRVLRMKGKIDVPNQLDMTIDEAQFPGFLLSVDYSI